MRGEKERAPVYLMGPPARERGGARQRPASFGRDFPPALGGPWGRRQHLAPQTHTGFNLQRSKARILFTEQALRGNERELSGKKPGQKGLWFAEETAAPLTGRNPDGGEGDSCSFNASDSKTTSAFEGVQQQAHAFQLSSKWQDNHSLPLEWAQDYFSPTICFCHPWEPSN